MLSILLRAWSNLDTGGRYIVYSMGSFNVASPKATGLESHGFRSKTKAILLSFGISEYCRQGEQRIAVVPSASMSFMKAKHPAEDQTEGISSGHVARGQNPNRNPSEHPSNH